MDILGEVAEVVACAVVGVVEQEGAAAFRVVEIAVSDDEGQAVFRHSLFLEIM